VVFTQIGNLIGRRYARSGLDAGLFRNPLFVVGIALDLAFALAGLYWPPLSVALVNWAGCAVARGAGGARWPDAVSRKSAAQARRPRLSGGSSATS
jgi:hypothetical protein